MAGSSNVTTANQDHRDLTIGFCMVAAAPVFAAADLYLVGRSKSKGKPKLELGDKLSVALWGAALTSGLGGSLLVCSVIGSLVDKVEAARRDIAHRL